MIWRRPRWNSRRGIGWIRGRSWRRRSSFLRVGWRGLLFSFMRSIASLCRQTMDASWFIMHRPLCRVCFMVFSGIKAIANSLSFCSYDWECWGCWIWFYQTTMPWIWSKKVAVQQSFNRSVSPDTTNQQAFHGLACREFTARDTPACHTPKTHYSPWFPFSTVQSPLALDSQLHQWGYFPVWD